MELFQNVEKIKDSTAAAETKRKIAEVIRTAIGGIDNSKQTILNMGFRAYYKLIYDHKLEDKYFSDLSNQDFVVLYAVLLSERGKDIEMDLVKQKCLNALKLNKEVGNLIVFKTLNLINRRYPSFDVEVTLAQIYRHLQSNEVGIREEVLLFFNHCCIPEKRALEYFQFIIRYYPWTNRNKYYLLSSILNKHNLDHFLQLSFHDPEEFFAGLLLSLSYKSLLPASQYLIKALSKQSSKHLLHISATVLTYGKYKEVQNFYSNWFSYIEQKDTLFLLLQEKPEVRNSFENFSSLKDRIKAYRLILIFVMYSRYILNASKLHFFKISTELITNCFDYDNEAQCLIYKFIAENMCCFALEDCLEFLSGFIRHHSNIENAKMRNIVLGKVSTIVNYISKTFFQVHKLNEGRSTTFHDSVEEFFKNLHEIIYNGIPNEKYQPKIFALRLLGLLFRSLYQVNLEKNSKNCNLMQNQILGAFLIKKGVFKSEEMTVKLVNALCDPERYNDVLDLIVEILQKMRSVNSQCIVENCQKFSQSVDIDECTFSAYYAKVAIGVISDEDLPSLLFEYSNKKLRTEILSFQQDPLLTCKQRNHIFGYLEIINIVLPTVQAMNDKINVSQWTELLILIEGIQNTVLEFLNLTGLTEEQVYAASFQDMDESLELLVIRSNLNVDSHEECRKFLLMSFWLTLKACCDVATTLGYYFATKYKQDQDPIEEIENHKQLKDAYLTNLHKCLKLHVAVLVRCRHKGAIEAAGLSIGKLTKYITSQNSPGSEINDLIWDCLSFLFEKKTVSITRRGAGYSIMFLHVIKNDAQPGRPLLQRSLTKIFEILDEKTPSLTPQINNCDRIEALTLHYLCVLVKDSEIRNAISQHHNNIMLAAISKIDDPEWTICNAALQLFGALVPKIVGQRQATEFEQPPEWEPTEVTYLEILFNMPQICEYILNYCKEQSSKSSSTRSIILFLGFFSKIEHLPQAVDEDEKSKLFCLRELYWSLLQHPCEKVRRLAASCFVRAHNFRDQLPQILLIVSDLLFEVRNENLFEGLVFVICEGIAKMQHEGLHTIPPNELTEFYNDLRENLILKSDFESKLKPYTCTKLLDMLKIVNLDSHKILLKKILNAVSYKTAIKNEVAFGIDEWYENLKKYQEKSDF